MKGIAYTVIFFLIPFLLPAQKEQQPFYADIEAFRKADSIKFPAPNQILFIGSSSFTMWKDVNAYFPGKRILNRGFGGSTLMDVLHYGREVILPYKPRQIVIYCGENDLALSDTVTARHVLKRFELLYYFIRKHYPRVPLAYISMKPSPSRDHLMPKFAEANRLIRQFLDKKPRTVFINIYHKMLAPDGSPRKELFLNDELHMNGKGYAIWQKAIAPHLLK